MPHNYTEFTGFYSTSIKAGCFRKSVLRQCKIAQFCFLVEFPVAHVHLEDRPCPCLWEHSDRQTRRANPSHCSSYGIFNKRGKSPESKRAGKFRVPSSTYSLVCTAVSFADHTRLLPSHGEESRETTSCDFFQPIQVCFHINNNRGL